MVNSKAELPSWVIRGDQGPPESQLLPSNREVLGTLLAKAPPPPTQVTDAGRTCSHPHIRAAPSTCVGQQKCFLSLSGLCQTFFLQPNLSVSALTDGFQPFLKHSSSIHHPQQTKGVSLCKQDTNCGALVKSSAFDPAINPRIDLPYFAMSISCSSHLLLRGFVNSSQTH